MDSAKTVSRTGLFFFLGAGSLDSRAPLPTEASPAALVEASSPAAACNSCVANTVNFVV